MVDKEMNNKKKSMPNSFDASFWSQFAKGNWEEKPLILKNVNAPLMNIDDSTIFSMLVAYSDRCRKFKNVKGIKLFVDGQLQYEEDVLQVLPVRKDKTLLGYHKRMEKLFPDYCLVCDELLRVENEKWDLLTDFLQDLFQWVGFPNRFAEVGLYLGNYRKTPFGVHVDGCGVFSFPLIGTKKFRLWTPQYVKRNPKLERAHHFSQHKKSSLLLEADPGDMTYWPSNAWHIAESNGSFNATWSVGVWLDRSYMNVITETVNPLIEKKLQALGQSVTSENINYNKSGKVSSKSKQMEQAILKIKTLTKGELEEQLQLQRLIHASKFGLKNRDESRSVVKINIQDSIQSRVSQKPILWFQPKRLKNVGPAWFGYNGVLVEIPFSNRKRKSSALLKLVTDINLKKKCKLTNYLVDSKSLKQDLESLKVLHQAGAFSICVEN